MLWYEKRDYEAVQPNEDAADVEDLNDHEQNPPRRQVRESGQELLSRRFLVTVLVLLLLILGVSSLGELHDGDDASSGLLQNQQQQQQGYDNDDDKPDMNDDEYMQVSGDHEIDETEQQVQEEEEKQAQEEHETILLDEPFYPSPKERHGYLCMGGTWGRVNNQLIAVKSGILLAYLMNRTFVIPSVGYYYELERLNNIQRDLVETNRSKCHGLARVTAFDNHFRRPHGANLTRSDVISKMVSDTNGVKVLAIRAKTLFKTAWWTNYFFTDIERLFYANLRLQPRYEKLVNEYIAETFPDQEFAAVHLRQLEGQCYDWMRHYNHRKGLRLCDLTRPTFLEVEQDQINRTDLPIFVASDRQNMAALNSYVNVGEHLFNGTCAGAECAVIDFEIASRSNFFVGIRVSTASDTICKLRRYRPLRSVGHSYHSVVSWEPPKNGQSVTTPELAWTGPYGHP